MRSMTGYGQGMVVGEHFQWQVSLRGVNHRFLDIVLRGREDYSALETKLRQMLEAKLYRGRVEFTVEASPVGERQVEVEIDETLVAALQARLQSLVDAGVLDSNTLQMRDLLRLPGALQVRRASPGEGEGDRQALLEATQLALEQFVDSRCVEGAKLKEMLGQRLDGMAVLGKRFRQLREGATETHLAALRKKLVDLVGAVADESRLVQEAAILVERGDVSEELDRLGSHLEHFADVMENDESLGKRLDFLAQEILRELNTIGSKCRESEMTRAVVDGKVLCEQLREQVQNVE